MKKLATFVCLMTLSPLWSNSEFNMQSFFSYEEWKEMTAQGGVQEDCIVLIDGTRIPATIVQLPSLFFTFFTMDFDVSEVKTVTVVNKQNEVNIQYITQGGQNYIGKLSRGKFVCWVSDPSPKDPHRIVEKEIDPKLVNFIILAQRDQKNVQPNAQLASLELSQGEQFPVVLMSNPILLTDGWSEKKIKPEELFELTFDGGVHGQIVENHQIQDFGFMYVKDPHLMVQIPKKDCLLKLPWSQISHIQAFNNGFKRHNREPDFDRSVEVQEDMFEGEFGIPLPYEVCAHPDYLGITRGNLLQEGFAAHAIPPQVIEAIGGLGGDTLTAADILFDPIEYLETFENFIVEALEEPKSLLEEGVLDEEWAQADVKEPIIWIGIDEIITQDQQDIIWTEIGDEDGPLAPEEEAFLEEWLF